MNIKMEQGLGGYLIGPRRESELMIKGK